jgi:osmotically inducible lipoprotein OsmB
MCTLTAPAVNEGDLTMKRTGTVLLMLAALSLTGCAGMTDTQQRTLTGGAGGAAGGALVGAIAGNAGWGAAIGGAAGLAGGYIYDQHKQAEQRAYQQGVAAGRAGSN